MSDEEILKNALFEIQFSSEGDLCFARQSHFRLIIEFVTTKRIALKIIRMRIEVSYLRDFYRRFFLNKNLILSSHMQRFWISDLFHVIEQ